MPNKTLILKDSVRYRTDHLFGHRVAVNFLVTSSSSFRIYDRCERHLR